MRLVHLTDAHLTGLEQHSFWSLRGKRRLGYLSWWRKRRHELRGEVLQQVSAAVIALRPDVIAITGDLVHLGLADEIDAACIWLDSLARHTRVVLVPGNHDYYQADSMRHVRASWFEYLGLPADEADHYPVSFKHDNCFFIGLCSAYPSPFWSAAGQLGQAQLNRLRQMLDQSRSYFRCVLIHHPPMPGVTSARKALLDAAELSELLDQYGVELVMHGHLHHNSELLLGHRTRVLATAAASSRTHHAPASFRVLDIETENGGWTIAASLYALDAAACISIGQQDRWSYVPVH